MALTTYQAFVQFMEAYSYAALKKYRPMAALNDVG
jgi:hypothetical protein